MKVSGKSSVLSELLKQKQAMLEPHFKPGLLQRDSTVFQLRFETADDFFLVVTPDSFRFVEGNATDPTLTLYLDHHDTCWQLLSGTLGGMEAFMDGRYRADGHIVLSQLVLYLFKSDDPTVLFKVQD